MIGSSNNIGSYEVHSHEHSVTNCLHENHEAVSEGGSMASGIQQKAAQELQKQESFSVTNMLVDGWKNLYSKTTGLIGKIWNDAGDIPEEEGTISNINPTVANPAITDAAADSSIITETVATANVKTQKENKKEDAAETEEALENVESAVSGGLKRDREGVKKFFQKVSSGVAKVEQFWKEEEPQPEAELSANNTDFSMGDNSYLLDSYNKSGQYSTLAKDRSLDGNFRAKG